MPEVNSYSALGLHWMSIPEFTILDLAHFMNILDVFESLSRAVTQI